MITGAHTLLYSTDPDATRAFLRDVLQLPAVDAGEGWLIFNTGPSEVGVHPMDDPAAQPSHQLTLITDDVNHLAMFLTDQGVTVSEIHDMGWGRALTFPVPGVGELMAYQPQHARP